MRSAVNSLPKPFHFDLMRWLGVAFVCLAMAACGGGGGGDSGGGGTGGGGTGGGGTGGGGTGGGGTGGGGTGGGGTGGGGTGGGGSTPQPSGAPAITGQPANVSITEGNAASFSVTVTGTAPLTYVWQRNGVAIAGNNSATYSLATTTVADSGAQFNVVVSNAEGTVTSTPATLNVSPVPVAPMLTSQPAAVTAVVGQTASFSVVATGSGPLTYQWQRNGQAITGATGDSYTTLAVSVADSGASFVVVVSNSVGAVTSSAAVLTVNPVAMPPMITTQPQPQVVTAGQNASFSVVATGDAPLAYQWRRDGADIAGATGASYSTPVTTAEFDGAIYDVVVSNATGSATSNPALLRVNMLPVLATITTQPQSVSVLAGQTATFTVAATGTAPLTYQWQRNDVAILGANSNSYTTPALAVSDSGSQYSVSVTNVVGVALSASALVTVDPVPMAPTIVAQPSSLSVVAGQTASFAVEVTGMGPLSFQWRKNGIDVAGATLASYTTPATAVTDNGSLYSVAVRNSTGVTESASAVLTVSAPPVAPGIITQPTAQTVFVGQAASFSVLASGTTPLSIQWRKNGSDIPGATAANYTTPVTALADNGASYTAVIRNSAGSATSDVALLNVSVPVPVNTWLRGDAGLARAGTLTFGSGALAGAVFDLTLVDPARPSMPQLLASGGNYLIQAVASEPLFNPQNPGDATERFIVYASGIRLLRVDLQIGSVPAPVPVPSQVSNATLVELCAPTLDNATAPFFADSADASASVLQYRKPGPDNQCGTTDDQFVAFRIDADANTSPTLVPRLLAAVRSSAGRITGFLARQGNDIVRLDANFSNGTSLFTVGSGEVEFLRQPGGAGLIVVRDGNTLRAFDPASGVAPVTIGTAAADFQQFGEIGGPVPTAIYRNEGRIQIYRLDNSSLLTPVLTLTSGQTTTRGGGDTQQLLLVVTSGGTSQLVRITPNGSVNTLFSDVAVIDTGSVGITPTAWVYTAGGRTALRSVPRVGGAARTLAQASELRVFNIGSWPYESVWYELRGPNGALFGSRVEYVRTDGSNRTSLANTTTVGGASFNGFPDTSVGRIVARDLSANQQSPYASAELLALDPITGGTRVVYGTLGNSRYNSLDVSRLSGPARPVLVTAAEVGVVGGSSSDLYLVRVGSPGLVRVTNFVP